MKLRFVDRDMFMRYTHYGIGHPAVLREMTRDCADLNLANSPESEDDDDDVQPSEGDSEMGGTEGNDEEDEDTDEEECEDDESIDDRDEGMEDDKDGVDEEDDRLYF